MQLCLIISRLSIDKKITTPDYLSFVSRHIVIESNIATNSLSLRPFLQLYYRQLTKNNLWHVFGAIITRLIYEKTAN